MYWKGRRKKIAVINSSGDKDNKKRKMRKRKNKDSIDETNQGLFIKQKNRKKFHQKKSWTVPETEPKKKKCKRKTKVKVEIKTEIKPPTLANKEKIKASKRKRKTEINIDEMSKKPNKWRKRSKKLFIDQIVEREGRERIIREKKIWQKKRK